MKQTRRWMIRFLFKSLKKIELMNKIFRNTCLLFAAGMVLVSCKKFEDINVNPIAANGDQAQVEYFLNGSIIGAQQNPDVAERSFVLYWKTAAHQQEDEGLSSGSYNDGWSGAYYNQVSEWLNQANTAIQIGKEHTDKGIAKPYTNNSIQAARIWRAYLMSEMSDVFGPIPLDGFQAKSPQFSDVKGVYYYLLSELTDATSKIDPALTPTDAVKKLDPAYAYDYKKWIKFANSLRMRLAMRLSEVDPAKAKSEFEAAAATNSFITTADEMFQVQEKPGWDALTGVMSREWNPQFLSATLNNIYIGLGGVKSETLVDESFKSYVKPANYIGLKFENHFTTKTNDPSAGYWLDGLPEVIDPRAYKAFIIPGDFENPNFSSYPSWDQTSKTTKRDLVDASGAVVKSIEAKGTWNPSINGDWGTKGSLNKVMDYYNGTIPRLSQQFRASSSKRIFFASWETYFLLAEAATRGWTTPVDGKTAYETGIAKSFEYWGITPGAYLSSQDFNRMGTSVNWDHTTEPPATHAMNFVNGYTGAAGVANINYPKNDLYKNGAVKNDHLTKILTQKFIAQCPWQPLEVWSDHRRLGLPFFENPAIENPLVNLPALTNGNYMTSSVKFFPQRIKYPSNLQNTNAAGYQQAVAALGGADAILTPLWWAKK
jgi:hypothetical protein